MMIASGLASAGDESTVVAHASGVRALADLSLDSDLFVDNGQSLLDGDDCLGADPILISELRYIVSVAQVAANGDPSYLRLPVREPSEGEESPLEGILEFAGPLTGSAGVCPATAQIGTMSITLTASAAEEAVELNDQFAAGVAERIDNADPGNPNHHWRNADVHLSVAGTQLYGIKALNNVGAILIAGAPIPTARVSSGAGCGVVVDTVLKDLVKSTCSSEASRTLVDWDLIDRFLPAAADDLYNAFNIVVRAEGSAAIPCED